MAMVDFISLGKLTTSLRRLCRAAGPGCELVNKVEGLYKGIETKLVQSVLTAAVLFAGQHRIYEMTKKVRVELLQRCVSQCVSRH